MPDITTPDFRNVSEKQMNLPMTKQRLQDVSQLDSYNSCFVMIGYFFIESFRLVEKSACRDFGTMKKPVASCVGKWLIIFSGY